VQSSTAFDASAEFPDDLNVHEHDKPTMSRRGFVLGGLVGATSALGLSGIEAYKARYVNPFRPELERVAIPAPPQASGLIGLRIGFITDTHVGPFISQDDLVRATTLMSDERPDLILLGGDYISESPRYAGPTAEVLGALVNAAPLGGFAVLGNHDLSVSAQRVTTALADVGIPVLRNDATSIDHGGSTLWIAGIDETLLGDPNPPETFAQIPDGAASLALWHEPQFAEHASAHGAFLQLSGHTHGGQIRLPGVGAIGLPIDGKRHVIGLTDADGMPVYTARGVGVYRPPMRVNCPPEVTILTLT
jgi:predicted MPP superfamily phosphohydrolase